MSGWSSWTGWTGWMSGWFFGAREWFRMHLFRRHEDSEMDAELQFHIDMETEQNIRRGMSPGVARRKARRDFGGVEGHRESLREGRRWPVLEDLVLDLRHGIRSLLRVPGFAATIIIALSLGIGTSVAGYRQGFWRSRWWPAISQPEGRPASIR